MKIKKTLPVLMVFWCGHSFAFDQSHLPNPPIDMVKDPLASRRYNNLMQGLCDHGITNSSAWRVGEFGMYIVDEYGEPIADKYRQPVWNTNTAQFWDGAWAENTNGWRVELGFHFANTPDVHVVISVGSLVRNSDDGTGAYVMPRWDTCAKFELKSPDGKVLKPNPGSLPEVALPSRMPVKLFPITQLGFHEGEIWFVTNGPPCPIASYALNWSYAITNEGDYTLTVRPVLYQNRTGKKIEITKDFRETNTNYFDRVDLPSVTTKVHLVPSH